MPNKKAALECEYTREMVVPVSQLLQSAAHRYVTVGRIGSGPTMNKLLWIQRVPGAQKMHQIFKNQFIRAKNDK